MIISVSVDAAEVKKQLGELSRQAPFAMSLAINNTLADVQRAEQVNMGRVFHLRGTDAFFRRAVKMQRSTKNNLTGNVRVEGPYAGDASTAGRVSRDILRHEDGGSQTSTETYRAGNKLIAGGFYLPAKGLRTISANVPRRLYPHNIGALARRDASGREFFASNQKGRKRKRGEQGREASYYVTERGIFERRHLGTLSVTRLIWAFVRRITLKPRLGFLDKGQATADATYNTHMQNAIDQAIRTAFR